MESRDIIYDLITEKRPYRRFGYKADFHAMTLNIRPFAIKAFLMFEESVFRGLLLGGGLTISVYYSITRV